MLPETAEELWPEITAAEQNRDSKLERVRSMVKKSHGPAYDGEKPTDTGLTLENHYHEYCSLMIPRLIMDNPRVRVTSRDWSAMQSGEAEMSETDSISHCLNRWARDENIDDTLIGFANDGFYSYGVAYVTQEPLGGFLPEGIEDGLEGDTPMKPKVFTIEPERVFWDSVASDFKEIRFIGHTYVRDKADLLKTAREADKDDGWIIEAIEASAESARAEMGPNKSTRKEVNRKELRIREVWIPEHNQFNTDDAPGFHGTLYTMVESGDGSSSSGVFVREPQPFYGPRTGPYVMWGVYPVMGETFPLSPLVAVEAQISRLNDLSLAYSNAARKAKKGVAVPSFMADAAEQFKNFHDQDVFLVEMQPDQKVSDYVAEIELGGPNDKLLEYMEVERARLERTSGLSDAQRGSVTGQGTATEVAIADSASSVRVDFVKKRFTGAVQEIFEKVAWYFMEDDRSRYVLSPSVAEKYGMDPSKPLFYRPPEDDIPFEAYEFEIEAYSMERVSEGMHQKRVMDFLGIYTQLVPLAAQFPDVAPWNELAKKLAEAANIPDVGTMIDQEKAAAVGAQMAQQGQNPSQGGQGAPGGSMPMMPGQAMGAGLSGGLI